MWIQIPNDCGGRRMYCKCETVQCHTLVSPLQHWIVFALCIILSPSKDTLENTDFVLHKLHIVNLKSVKSAHHHTIQINYQPDASISPVYYLTFIDSSTSHAHHQELNNCSSSLWFYLRSVVIAVLLVVVRPGPTTTNSTATTTLQK
jgi:hypothetical protein